MRTNVSFQRGRAAAFAAFVAAGLGAGPSFAADESAYAAITNLEHAFIETLDRRDYSALADMFANGTLEIARPDLAEPPTATGAEAIEQMLVGMLPAPSPQAFGRHIASNLIIEIDEAEGTATSRMYTAAYLIAEGRPAHFLGVGHHESSFALVDGTWQFTDKVITGDAFYPPVP